MGLIKTESLYGTLAAIIIIIIMTCDVSFSCHAAVVYWSNLYKDNDAFSPPEHSQAQINHKSSFVTVTKPRTTLRKNPRHVRTASIVVPIHLSMV